MCGITGCLSVTAQGDIGPILRRMTDTVAHRGPDDAGHWVDASRGIGLGHRRLSIVELSPLGHQPMMSACGRYVLVFNGEIYNHLALRPDLGSLPWRGHADTETLLGCFTRHGVEASLPRLVGMFAFAVWDRHEAVLTLARDRLGEKPLYFGWQGQGGQAAFVFGSELKALRAHPAFQGDIDRDALCQLLRHDCIAAPHSIYRGIRKLEPGCSMTVSLSRPEPQIRAYWSLAEVARRGATTDRFAGSPADAVDALAALLTRAVAEQSVADVPLGAFLSGGIDSSTVVALMQAQSRRPVRTFAIGFHEPAYDEAAYAAAVARHLGTEHTELYVSADQAMAVIPRLPALYDEPFGDSSQIPTFLVSQLARQHVSVSLSGDAGDELFCGYPRYLASARRWRQVSALPAPLRRCLAAGLAALPAGLARHARWQRALALLRCATPEEVYGVVTSHWLDPAAVVLGGREPPARLADVSALSALDGVSRTMALDLLGYLPDDILTKLDRASMAVSLETRVPFLDHRVVEFACTLPLAYKLRGGQAKWPLRQVLQRYVPAGLVERPKMGFALPLDGWLRGPLRAWAESLLDESALRREGYLDASAVRSAWQQHLAGGVNRQHELWNILMFQAWRRANTA
jgi:asparagine synthase (glutamine-hydrolysing)